MVTARAKIGYETILLFESIVSAIKKMYLHGVEHLIVLDEDGIVAGVLSVKDIGRALLDAFEKAGEIERFNLKAFLDEPITDFYSKPAIALEGEISISDALRVLYEKNIGVLPVLDESGRLLKAYSELHASLLLLESRTSAKGFASFNVVWGEKDEPLIEALGFMFEGGFRRLPLIVDGRVFIAFLNKILYYLYALGSSDALLHPLVAVASPAIVLDSRTASLGMVAELILSLPERAVMVKDGDKYGIITVRDLLKAFVVAEE